MITICRSLRALSVPIAISIFGLCICALAVQARAQQNADILFDPTGTGNTGGALNVSALDLNVGNSLYQSINSLLVNETNQAVTHYYQASVGSLTGIDSNPILGSGVGSDYELTLVMGAPELATVNGNTTQFSLGSGSSFFELFYDTAVNSSNLNGTGFNDGTLILSGTVSAASGVLSRSNAAPTALDHFHTNNYPSISTLSVVGGGSYTVAINSVNTNYIVGPAPADLSFVIANTSDITPFNSTNPSGQFFNGSGLFTPSLSSVNGQGADFQTQADGNASFESSSEIVPEPSTFVLATIGVLGARAFLRRKAAEDRLA
jgi:hypothetical protein